MMDTVRGQRGSGRLGVLIWLVMMGAAVFTGVRAIPVRVAVYQFHDYVDEQVKFAAAASRVDPRKLTRRILEKAHELGLPLDKKQVEVKVKRNEVKVHVRHQVTVDLEAWKWTWKFDETFTHHRF